MRGFIRTKPNAVVIKIVVVLLLGTKFTKFFSYTSTLTNVTVVRVPLPTIRVKQQDAETSVDGTRARGRP